MNEVTREWLRMAADDLATARREQDPDPDAAALARLTAHEAGCRYPPVTPLTREQAREAVEWSTSIGDAALPLLEAGL